MAWLAEPAQALAQQYPARPIRFVLGFAPGGASDTMARVVATRLSENLGQPVVIDNRAGAGGNIAAEIVARSAPDGYTMLLGNNGILAVNVSLYPKLAFDPVKDFSPVVLIASQPNILVVHPAVTANSVKDLVALAKSKPGKLNYASPGNGTTGHLAGELFKRMVGIEYAIIPFKGGGPTALALLSGECQFTFATALSVQPHIKSGKLRALGGDHREALGKLPGPADGGRGRRAGVRRDHLARRGGAGAHAAAGDRALERRIQQAPADGRHARAFDGPRFRHHRRGAEAVDRVHAGRDPAVGEGDQGVGARPD